MKSFILLVLLVAASAGCGVSATFQTTRPCGRVEKAEVDIGYARATVKSETVDPGVRCTTAP